MTGSEQIHAHTHTENITVHLKGKVNPYYQFLGDNIFKESYLSQIFVSDLKKKLAVAKKDVTTQDGIQ
jgi:hypothetical protein